MKVTKIMNKSVLSGSPINVHNLQLQPENEGFNLTHPQQNVCAKDA